MPRKASKPVPAPASARRKYATRKSSSQTEKAFNSALSAAARRLESAISERAYHQSMLASINFEIPLLENTLVVLRNNVVRCDPRSVSNIGSTSELLVPSVQEIDFTGMGSAKAQSQNETGESAADVEPEEGGWQ